MQMTPAESVFAPGTMATVATERGEEQVPHTAVTYISRFENGDCLFGFAQAKPCVAGFMTATFDETDGSFQGVLSRSKDGEREVRSLPACIHSSCHFCSQVLHFHPASVHRSHMTEQAFHTLSAAAGSSSTVRRSLHRSV